MDLERAVLRTVAYGDVFDYPVRMDEIHRYLEMPAQRDEVESTTQSLVPDRLASADGYFHLAGRERLVDLRCGREKVAAELWPEAIRCGHAIARLPFVRMVALTGALAMNNVDRGADLDFLIVTERDRVWLCRAFIIQLVRLHRLRGIVICPNWVLSEDALELDQRDFFAARELSQMVALAGVELYGRMRARNHWTRRFLPNANASPRSVPIAPNGRSAISRTGEVVLRTGLGSALERWERFRKSREIARVSPGNPEVVLDRHQCKGHVDRHGQRITAAYAERLRALGLDDEDSLDTKCDDRVTMASIREPGLEIDS